MALRVLQYIKNTDDTYIKNKLRKLGDAIATQQKNGSTIGLDCKTARTVRNVRTARIGHIGRIGRIGKDWQDIGRILAGYWQDWQD